MDPQEQQNNQFGVLKLQSPPPLVDYPAESGFSFANPVYEPNVRKFTFFYQILTNHAYRHNLFLFQRRDNNFNKKNIFLAFLNDTRITEIIELLGPSATFN